MKSNPLAAIVVSLLVCAAMLAAQSPTGSPNVGARSTVVEFVSSNLPIIVIDTHGQAILDEPKITADMGIIYNGPGVRNYLTDPFNHYHGKIGIEVRGSSSQMFDKKQYAVETRDEQGNDMEVSLLDMPAESDWVLHAPYSDKSLMRNALAYHLANALGRYASRSRFCEVVLNGDYSGVYVLMEKIKRDKNRVNISKMGASDTTGDAVTGGYIIKIDKLEGAHTEGWYSAFLPYPGAWQRIYYQYDTPKGDEIAPAQKTYIQNYIRAFETVMAGPDFADPQRGYAAYLDINSFVDYFILTEVARNVDGYRLSAFMHKDRDSKNGKLVMGPVWDFDLAYGNANYYYASQIAGWQLYFAVRSDQFQIPFWWPKLMQDSSFARRVNTRWQQLRQNVLATSRIHAFIDSVAALLDEAQKRNFTRWPILGTYVWPNAYIGATYQQELTYLKNWVQLHTLWMDAKIPEFIPTGVATAARSGLVDFSLEPSYPNPLRPGRSGFNPATTIVFHLPRPQLVTLTIFDTSGRAVATLVNEKKQAGRHEVRFDASALASGVYFYRLRTGDRQLTKKFVFVR